MAKDLRSKLKRLGVTKGARHLKPAPPVKRDQEQPDASSRSANPFDLSPTAVDDDERYEVDIATLFPEGRDEETPYGRCFVVERFIRWPMSTATCHCGSCRAQCGIGRVLDG